MAQLFRAGIALPRAHPGILDLSDLGPRRSVAIGAVAGPCSWVLIPTPVVRTGGHGPGPSDAAGRHRAANRRPVDASLAGLGPGQGGGRAPRVGDPPARRRPIGPRLAGAPGSRSLLAA